MLAFGRLGLARVLAQVLGVDLEREVARLRPLQVVQVAHLVESEGGESALLVCYHQRQTFTTNTVKYSQIQSNFVKIHVLSWDADIYRKTSSDILESYKRRQC